MNGVTLGPERDEWQRVAQTTSVSLMQTNKDDAK